MKRILLSAALIVVAVSGAAEARNSGINNADRARIERFAPNYDLSKLTDQQVIILLEIINSSRRSGDAWRRVQAYLNSPFDWPWFKK